MATVYKARCQILNRYVAIKILKEEFTMDEEFIKRFKAEAQSAASLSHPNIVSIYDVGQEGRIHYIVMELVEGKTLKEIILEDGSLSWKWSVNVAAQIASALEVAHRNHIIHRDIKPHNIIITEDGIAKVTDFGIAKAVSNSTITAFGATIGSVHYFSPEHARGGFTDEKSDLYSLGVVLYELLTGRVPFDSDTPVSIALMHVQEKAVPPIEINSSIPKCVNDIVVKAMQKDANLRYQTATDMITDLQVALKNPDLDFVKIGEEDLSSKTQKIPSIDSNLIKKNKRNIEAKREKSKPEKKGLKELYKKSKSFRITTYIIGAILLFTIILVGTVFGLKSASPKDVEVPSLIGKSKLEAETVIKDSNLVFEVIEEVYDEAIPEGYIVWQNPESPMKIKENRTVQVKVSKGSSLVTLPDFSNMKYEDAVKKIEDLGLIADVKKENSSKIDEGNIIKQFPASKTDVQLRSTVTIYVSEGEEIIYAKVPNLIGKSETEAKKLLSDNKLLLKSPIEYVQDESKEDGVVIKQSVPASNSVEEMTAISITVNKLPTLINGTVVVDLTPYLPKTTSTTNTTNTTDSETSNDSNTEVTNTSTVKEKDEEITVKLIVDDSTVYEKSHNSSVKKISIPVKGYDKIDVKLYINDSLKVSRTMNLNSTTKLEI